MVKEKETKQKSSEKVHRRSQTGGCACRVQHTGTGPRGERGERPVMLKPRKEKE